MNNTLTNIFSGLQRHSKFVFANGDKPFVTVRTGFEKAIKRAGIEKVRFHDLRHTFATNLVLAGFDLVTVKELLGHSRIEMTMRYSHPSSENKKNAVDRLCEEQLRKDGRNT